MKVVVIGAGGFIGRHSAAALEGAGCTVRRAGRDVIDFEQPSIGRWRAELDGVDAIVNAAGVFRESDRATFDRTHADGPIALFALCAERGVAVVQISALGADADATTPFHITKKRADDALLALDVPSIVLQPSLVYGSDGKSARVFTSIASMPVIGLPAGGTQMVQPVHVDDVAAAVVSAVTQRQYPRARIACVGPKAMSLRGYMVALREAMGLRRPLFVNVPMPLVKLVARARIGLLDPDALAMLERGNTADPVPFAVLIGRRPRDASAFVAAGERAAARLAARIGWTAPLLRIAIAFVWIATGVVSAGIYPVADSYALLARTGVTGAAATVALYGAAVADFAIGIATLTMKRRRWLWRLQAALIVGYTAIITVFLPEQWLHPYGPVTKNIPLLAAILLLHEIEDREDTDHAAGDDASRDDDAVRR